MVSDEEKKIQQEEFKKLQDAAVALLKGGQVAPLWGFCFDVADPNSNYVCKLCGCLIGRYSTEIHIQFHAELISIKTICGIMAPQAYAENALRRIEKAFGFGNSGA